MSGIINPPSGTLPHTHVASDVTSGQFDANRLPIQQNATTFVRNGVQLNNLLYASSQLQLYAHVDANGADIVGIGFHVGDKEAVAIYLDDGQLRLRWNSGKDTLLVEGSSGLWTPDIKGNATTGTVSYLSRNARYSLNGKLCHASFTIVNAAYSGIPVGENLIIDGLPFTAASGNGGNGSLIASYFSGITLPSGYTQLGGRVINGTSRLEFMRSGSGVFASNLQVGGLTSGGNVLEGTIIYTIA